MSGFSSSGKPARLVNLTPHPINLLVEAENGEEGMLEIPSQGVARVSEIITPISRLPFEGVTALVVSKQYGQVEGLPDTDPNHEIIYIVSLLVRASLSHRNDLVSPGELIRNDKGVIVGAKNLCIN